MIHNIKFPDGTIKAVDCKLGSGITDKNGREIFEGDTLTNGKKKFPVFFTTGALAIRFDNQNLGGLYDVRAFEIVND